MKTSMCLIVEDIVDTGLTLNYLVENLTSSGTLPASGSAFSPDKAPVGSRIPVKIDYNGFTVPDEFYHVGYGPDYNERYRNFPYYHGSKQESIRRGKIDVFTRSRKLSQFLILVVSTATSLPGVSGN